MGSSTQRLAVASAVLALAGCHDESNNDFGPGDVPPHGQCALTGSQIATPGFGLPAAMAPGGGPLRACEVVDRGPCACGDYSGGFPPDVFNYRRTYRCQSAQSAPGRCPVGDTLPGCNNNVAFAVPDCAQIAEVGGIASHVADPNASGDDDFYLNVCPTPQSMRVDPFSGSPFTGPFQELRSAGSFGLDQAAAGRVHVEVQQCRFYMGAYRVPEIATPLAAAPVAGDRVNAAGDWVIDVGHSDWTEIHEARALAVVRPVSARVSYILLNAFFVEGSRQRDLIHLDVQLPRPAGGRRLSCALTAAVPPGCPLKPGVRFTRLEGAVDESADFGVCTIELARGVETPPLHYGCADTCGGKSSLELGCDRIFFAGAIRAEWSDGLLVDGGAIRR